MTEREKLWIEILVVVYAFAWLTMMLVIGAHLVLR
jgi:hypothetical protein